MKKQRIILCIICTIIVAGMENHGAFPGFHPSMLFSCPLSSPTLRPILLILKNVLHAAVPAPCSFLIDADELAPLSLPLEGPELGKGRPLHGPVGVHLGFPARECPLPGSLVDGVIHGGCGDPGSEAVLFVIGVIPFPAPPSSSPPPPPPLHDPRRRYLLRAPP